MWFLVCGSISANANPTGKSPKEVLFLFTPKITNSCINSPKMWQPRKDTTSPRHHVFLLRKDTTSITKRYRVYYEKIPRHHVTTFLYYEKIPRHHVTTSFYYEKISRLLRKDTASIMKRYHVTTSLRSFITKRYHVFLFLIFHRFTSLFCILTFGGPYRKIPNPSTL